MPVQSTVVMSVSASSITILELIKFGSGRAKCRRVREKDQSIGGVCVDEVDRIRSSTVCHLIIVV